MTMKYTHIGIADQALALSKLPSALQMRCISGGVGGQNLAQADTKASVKKRQNPCDSKGFGKDRRQLAKTDKMEDRGLEPLTSCMPCTESDVNLGRMVNFRLFLNHTLRIYSMNSVPGVHT